MKTCTKCNIEKDLSEFYKHKTGKYGVLSQCKSCVKESKKEYREINKDKIKKYQEINKDKLKDRIKEYREINKEKIKESSKEYYYNNKDKIKESRKEYREVNKDKIKEYKKKYQQSEHGKLIAVKHSSKRRALNLNAEGNYTVEEILILFDKQEGRCIYCDNLLETSGKNKYHIDHIQPLSKNGSNWISNLQLLCPHCNFSKKDKNHEEFIEYLEINRNNFGRGGCR